MLFTDQRRFRVRMVGLVLAALVTAACGPTSDAEDTAAAGGADLKSEPAGSVDVSKTDPADETSAPTEPASDEDPGPDATATTTVAGSETDNTEGESGLDSSETTSNQEPEADTTPGADAEAEIGTVRPDWLGLRPLPVNADGVVPPQETPPEMVNRRFPTIDLLPPPVDDRFRATVEPVPADVLARSTWSEDCPVTVDELRYLKLSFWGFDERPHTGEMIVHADVSQDTIQVFRQLFDARFPIEEMRVTASAELDADPTGDGNNTTSFVCRAVVGGSRFSEHASGLAIDINPFHNPYQKGDVVLPELSTSYLDRSNLRPGMIVEDGPVVSSFDAIGWGWGGRWRSLDDYHHFSLNNR